jgi:hypothetical protein
MSIKSLEQEIWNLTEENMTLLKTNEQLSDTLKLIRESGMSAICRETERNALISFLMDAIKNATDYLGDSELNTIRCGSKAHMELRDALTMKPPEALTAVRVLAIESAISYANAEWRVTQKSYGDVVQEYVDLLNNKKQNFT